MSSIRWCICAAPIDMVSNAGIAQQTRPRDPAGPSGRNLRVVSEGPIAGQRNSSPSTRRRSN